MGRTYAVVWRDKDATRRAGKLQIVAGGARLEGGAHGGRVTVHAIPGDQISDARLARTPAERLDGRPTIVLSLSSGDEVSMSPLDGLGTVPELVHLLANLGPRMQT